MLLCLLCSLFRTSFAIDISCWLAASKEVIPVHQFFIKLNSIVNIVGALFKRNDQLKAAHAANIAHLLQNDELESGKGCNQISSLLQNDELEIYF